MAASTTARGRDRSSSTTPPLPRELQVEITAACNLRCRMCLVRYQPPVDRVSGSFSADDFYRLVDANPGVEKITLQGLGEPLLVPHLVAMVAYAAARGASVGFNTNATLLTAERSAALVEAGLGWLHVSLDGATAETYESVRDGARFEKVCRHVRQLVAARERLGAERPHLQIVFVAMRRNVAELPAVVRLADELGIDHVWVQNLSHSFSDTDPSGRFVEIRSFTEREALWREGPPSEGGGAGADPAALFAEARDVAGELGVTLRLPRTEEPPPAPRRPGEPGCDWPWRSTYVTYDGVVQPCCMVMGSERAALGSLSEQSFDDIWRDEPYRRFREALLGSEPPDVCRGCSLYHGTF